MSTPIEIVALVEKLPKAKALKVPKSPKISKLPNILTMTPANTIVASAVSIAPPSSELAKYQKMSDKEHILKKPDTYIGSTEMTESEMFVYESSSTSSEAPGIISRKIQYIPGLYKLFDEGAITSFAKLRQSPMQNPAHCL